MGASVQAVSDYLWYSLDLWGQDHSDQPINQCITWEDCLGNEYASEKCCAGISMTSLENLNIQQVYWRRCLDKGLIGSNMQFNVGTTIDVGVQCESSNAVVLATGFAVAAVIAAII